MHPLNYSLGKTMPEPDYDLAMDGGGNTAVYVLSRNSGEGADRKCEEGDIQLTKSEIRDILELDARYENFCLVLNTGGLVELEPVKEVKSILLLGQLGSATGDVLANILLGKAYPSGKLAMTWAPVADFPSTKGFGDRDNTYYEEGIFVGYRYFDIMKKEPLYPFGFGLSYTDFEISCKKFAADIDTITVAVRVKNTGCFVGKEVVQVYYSAPDGMLAKSLRELAGYAKTRELSPGEEDVVTISFPLKRMASYSQEDAGYLLEAGDYLILAGNSSRNISLAGVVQIQKRQLLNRLAHICQAAGEEEWTVPSPKRRNMEELVSEDVPVVKMNGEIPCIAVSYRDLPREIPAGEPIDFQRVVDGKASIEAFIAGLEYEQLCFLAVGNYERNQEIDPGDLSAIGNSGSRISGSAGETTSFLSGQSVNGLVMCDGPAGLRVNRKYTVDEQGTVRIYEYPFGKEELAMMGEDLAGIFSAPPQIAKGQTLCYQYCTAIPVGSAIAQSFNEELERELGDLIGEEMEMIGADLWLAPALNIQRSPLCGRNFEYFSEDPLVSGLTAAAITRGVQAHSGCGVTLKHFAANNQETNRYGSNSVLSERALREIYLKGFEIAIRESDPAAIMTSYNLVNGEHTCNSRDLVTKVLRDEWGYQGLVMTDWGVTDPSMRDPNGEHSCASAAGCVRAGNNITMPGGKADVEDMKRALCDPSHPYPITRALLQENAGYLLKLIRRLQKQKEGKW